MAYTTIRRKNGTHVNNSKQKNRVVNPAQKAKEERRKFNEQIKLESEKIKDEIVKVKNAIKTLKTFLKKKNQALPQLPEIDWINVPLRFKEEYETIYNKAKEKLEN